MALLLAAAAVLILVGIAAVYFGLSNSVTRSAAVSLLKASSERNALKNAGQRWAAALQVSLDGGAVASAAPYQCSTSGGPAVTDTQDSTITHACREVSSGSSNPAKKAFVITSVRGLNQATTRMAYSPGTPVTPGVCTASSTNPSVQGSGTQVDPYIICNFTQLNNIQDNYSYTKKKIYFKLANDITAPTGASFHPIGGKPQKAFSGGFDGDGHTISNLAIQGLGGGNGLGLIGVAATVTVQNLRISNLTVNGSMPFYAGALVGYGPSGSYGISNSSITISNCIVDGFTMVGWDRVGGLIGDADGQAFIYDSHAINLNIESTSTIGMTGGLIAEAHDATIERSWSSGQLNASVSGGGLLGLVLKASIKDSYSVANVKKVAGSGGNPTAMGGVVGKHDGSNSGDTLTLTNVYAAGPVESTSTHYGGLLAWQVGPSTATATGSFWDSSGNGITAPGTGQGSSAGTGATAQNTATMKAKTIYNSAGWSTAVWSLGGHYPTLLSNP